MSVLPSYRKRSLPIRFRTLVINKKALYLENKVVKAKMLHTFPIRNPQPEREFKLVFYPMAFGSIGFAIGLLYAIALDPYVKEFHPTFILQYGRWYGMYFQVLTTIVITVLSIWKKKIDSKMKVGEDWNSVESFNKHKSLYLSVLLIFVHMIILGLQSPTVGAVTKSEAKSFTKRFIESSIKNPEKTTELFCKEFANNDVKTMATTLPQFEVGSEKLDWNDFHYSYSLTKGKGVKVHYAYKSINEYMIKFEVSQGIHGPCVEQIGLYVNDKFAMSIDPSYRLFVF